MQKNTVVLDNFSDVPFCVVVVPDAFKLIYNIVTSLSMKYDAGYDPRSDEAYLCVDQGGKYVLIKASGPGIGSFVTDRQTYTEVIDVKSSSVNSANDSTLRLRDVGAKGVVNIEWMT